MTTVRGPWLLWTLASLKHSQKLGWNSVLDHLCVTYLGCIAKFVNVYFLAPEISNMCYCESNFKCVCGQRLICRAFIGRNDEEPPFFFSLRKGSFVGQDISWWRHCQLSWNVAVILMFQFCECAKDLIIWCWKYFRRVSEKQKAWCAVFFFKCVWCFNTRYKAYWSAIL